MDCAIARSLGVVLPKVLAPAYRHARTFSFKTICEQARMVLNENVLPTYVDGTFVPRTGFEPAHPYGRCDLNTVRLPISPPGQLCSNPFGAANVTIISIHNNCDGFL
jgi:hypothetical protein